MTCASVIGARRTEGRTNSGGQFTFRGFAGQYEVTATAGGKEAKGQFDLRAGPGGKAAACTVTLPP